VSGIVFGAVAPHGPIAVREACTQDELEQAATTLAGFDSLAERCAACNPQIILIATPHSVHVDGTWAHALSLPPAPWSSARRAIFPPSCT
jgi:hypothetical protein